MHNMLYVILLCRGKVKRGKATGEVSGGVSNMQKQPSDAVMSEATQPSDEPESDALLLQDKMKWIAQDVVKKVVSYYFLYAILHYIICIFRTQLLSSLLLYARSIGYIFFPQIPFCIFSQ